MLRLIALICVMLFIASGCSWQQAYSTAQGWQRNQCYRVVEQTERERCLSGTNMPYDDYRQQNEGAKKD